jgi:hypothetical protein
MFGQRRIYTLNMTVWQDFIEFAAKMTTAGGIVVLFTKQTIWYFISLVVYISFIVPVPCVYSYRLSTKKQN